MSASIRIRSLLSVAIATRGFATAALLLGLSACGNNNAPANNAAPGRPASTSPATAKPAAAPASASTQGQAQAQQAAAQARLDSMSVKDLLAAGNTAINQQKLVSPKGDNAFEYYEKALQKDPKDQAAQDALREQFPFGANAVQQSIAQNNFDDAQREIGLLANADPGNYTLKILNSKLDAAKKQQVRAEALKAKQAADLAAKQAEAAKAAAARAAAAAQPTPPLPAAQKPVVQQPAPAPVQQVPKPTPPPPPTGETRAAQVVNAAAPEYPIQAARNHQSGYATVEFTVGTDGSVSGAHVISSNNHVFDSAAVQAISRSKFRPALKAGQPVSSTLQRRIDFNLGG